MPEGHTIHRYARRHLETLGGQRLAVSSPQGRFADGAARLDGRRLEEVDAVGKHLFYRWEGDETLHVHLGLFGRFRTHRVTVPEPSDGTRLAMVGDEATVYLSGPTACELIGPDEEVTIRERLGPDPLAAGVNGDGLAQLRHNLSRRRIPIGAALLNQSVVAGVGNVYRAEVLFLAGIHPATPANEVTPDEVRTIWELTRQQLRRGERAGRIVTVDPHEVGARSRRDLSRDERLYVYKRNGEPCRRCGVAITADDMANRTIWWCPSCQDGAN
ncbi:MAG: Fpg/Nei family DNA glycosylase [Acidimicrobiia bacterium]|nr:Fpg/Nei family DNA glycosylase [Acidimicrobiia bacterium]